MWKWQTSNYHSRTNDTSIKRYEHAVLKTEEKTSKSYIGGEWLPWQQKSTNPIPEPKFDFQGRTRSENIGQYSYPNLSRAMLSILQVKAPQGPPGIKLGAHPNYCALTYVQWKFVSNICTKTCHFDPKNSEYWISGVLYFQYRIYQGSWILIISIKYVNSNKIYFCQKFPIIVLLFRGQISNGCVLPGSSKIHCFGRISRNTKMEPHIPTRPEVNL